MIKNITELITFLLFFIFVMFLPLINLEMIKCLSLAQEDSIVCLIITFTGLTLIIPFALKLQWLILILTVSKIKKHTKNPFLINLLTNLKLNAIILGLGFILDICIWKYLADFSWYKPIYVYFYWIYFSFTSNYIIVFLMVCLDENNIGIKCCCKKFLNCIQKQINNFGIVQRIINYKYLNQIKNIIELIAFILFFTLVMFWPLINWYIIDNYFSENTKSLLLFFVSLICLILLIPLIFKLQWVILQVVVNKTLKKTTNPLLINLFTNLKLNNIILTCGLLYDICICIYAQNFVYDLLSQLNYWLYLSFTSNYIVIYLNAFLRADYEKKV